MNRFEDKKNTELSTQVPCILILDDDGRALRTQREFFEDVGYAVETTRTVERATAILGSRRVDLVIVDGDLGDGKYDEQSVSGRFILEHIQGRIRYVRSSMYGGEIPENLHGETPGEAGFNVFDRVLKILPLPDSDVEQE